MLDLTPTRDPDARNGVISFEAARDVYGVVVAGDNCNVDEAVTAVLRKG